MARRTLENRRVRKLYKNSGGTTIVSIPVELMRELRWRDGQKVTVERAGKNIIIKDWKK